MNFITTAEKKSQNLKWKEIEMALTLTKRDDDISAHVDTHTLVMSTCVPGAWIADQDKRSTSTAAPFLLTFPRHQHVHQRPPTGRIPFFFSPSSVFPLLVGG